MINNTYISSEGDRGMWKKKSSKNKKIHQFSMFSCPCQTCLFDHCLTWNKRLSLGSVMSLSDSPWLVDPSESGVKKGCPNNPLHMGWGGEEKLSKIQSVFKRNKGARQTQWHYWQLKITFKKPQDLCCLFLIVSFEIVIHKLGYKRVDSVRVWEGENMLHTLVRKGESEVIHFCSHVGTWRK